ncbi:MAG TPA: FliM/FliN family flagellar motor C-terminal domain-containing protein [Phycisphaerales bacterium]|jgi:flagellar motor switch protein FliN/FliY|nr:FliM/FliN family flagellar motor C-terminal domain-containing protein [Phycisphaerales bacterium]
MASDLQAILSLEVPLIVLLGERVMRVSEVCALGPGAIVELPKGAEEELTLLVNNKPVGTGVAVKVGENFGIRITYMGDLRERIEALGGAESRGGAGVGEAAMAG